MIKREFMSPVSPVFHTEVTVSIGLKTYSRMGTYNKLKSEQNSGKRH